MFDCMSAARPFAQGGGCGCTAHGRRAVLGRIAGALGLALGGRRAGAGDGRYEAMLVNCIDPRLTSGSHRYMAGLRMRDLYSHFVIAGGPLGAVHPRFASWHASFWDNLDITCALHRIGSVVALTHRDCGAARLAFGEAAVATPAREGAAHAEVLRAFRAEVARRRPGLGVVTGIMALNGSVEEVC